MMTKTQRATMQRKNMLYAIMIETIQIQRGTFDDFNDYTKLQEKFIEKEILGFCDDCESLKIINNDCEFCDDHANI